MYLKSYILLKSLMLHFIVSRSQPAYHEFLKELFFKLFSQLVFSPLIKVSISYLCKNIIFPGYFILGTWKNSVSDHYKGSFIFYLFMCYKIILLLYVMSLQDIGNYRVSTTYLLSKFVFSIPLPHVLPSIYINLWGRLFTVHLCFSIKQLHVLEIFKLLQATIWVDFVFH